MSRTESKILGVLRSALMPLTKHDIGECLGYDPYTVGKVLLKLKGQGCVKTLDIKRGRQFLYVIEGRETFIAQNESFPQGVYNPHTPLGGCEGCIPLPPSVPGASKTSKKGPICRENVPKELKNEG